MLYSRSAIISDNPSNNLYNFDITGKTLAKKPNGAVLPQLIYNSPSRIEFSKEQIIKILRLENKIRLSNKAKELYDINKSNDVSIHLKIDKDIIKKALKNFGYKPEEDDSLKAYHIATSKFINDEEVRNSVVWMRYDKCKIGDYTLGDHLNFDNIKLFDMDEKVCLLKNLISNDRPNLIVSGSMS